MRTTSATPRRAAFGIAGLVVAFAVLGGAATVATAHPAQPHECTRDSTFGGYTCLFYCHAGQYLRVSAENTNTDPFVHPFPRITATCGGVTVSCQSSQSCGSNSFAGYDTVCGCFHVLESTSEGVGTCRIETAYTIGTCAAYHVVNVPDPDVPTTCREIVEEAGLRKLGPCKPVSYIPLEIDEWFR